MPLPFMQANLDIYQKFDALKGSEGGPQGIQILDYLIAGCVALVALLVLSGFYRFLTRTRPKKVQKPLSRTRGDIDPNTELALDDLAGKSGARDNLSSLAKGIKVTMFWNLNSTRCAAGAEILGQEDGQVELNFESDSIPLDGDAVVIYVEPDGHVLFYRVTLAAGDAQTARRAKQEAVRGTSRMHRRYRAHVALQGAASYRPDGGGDESVTACVVRVHDIALDGMGILSEEELRPGQEISCRLQFPDYLDPITIQTKVSWAQMDVAGIFRAGLEIDGEHILESAMIADYMHAVLRTESESYFSPIALGS